MHEHRDFTDEEIYQAITKGKELGLASIVRHYRGFIILAQSESDFMGKAQCILHGDQKGFFTVKELLERDC